MVKNSQDSPEELTGVARAVIEQESLRSLFDCELDDSQTDHEPTSGLLLSAFIIGGSMVGCLMRSVTGCCKVAI